MEGSGFLVELLPPLLKRYLSYVRMCYLMSSFFLCSIESGTVQTHFGLDTFLSCFGSPSQCSMSTISPYNSGWTLAFHLVLDGSFDVLIVFLVEV